MVRHLSIAAGLAAAVLFVGCAGGGPDLPDGAGAVEELCDSYLDVSTNFPLAIPADEANEPRNLASESALDQLAVAVADLRDAVDSVAPSRAREAFERYVQETSRAIAGARQEAGRIEPAAEWLDTQDELNREEAGARERLSDALGRIGVELEAACS